MIANMLYLDPACLGTGMVLTNVTPISYGTDGVRLSEPVGYRYEVMLPAHRYDKLQVRIDGKQLMETPLAGAEPVVEFTDLRARPYVNRNSGGMAFSAAATGIRAVKGTTAAKN